MNNPAVLVWKSDRFPRKFQDAEGKYLPLSSQVYTHPSIDIIARVVCRNEIEEARKRVILNRGKYYFKPSTNYLKARTSVRLDINRYV